MVYTCVTPDSSRITKFSYNSLTKYLVIYFRDKNQRVYLYSDVPFETVNQMSDAESPGKFFNTYIRGKFSYREVDSEEANILIHKAKRD